MDRDDPKNTQISRSEFVYYYNAYEDYLRDAFASFCRNAAAEYTAEQLQAAEWYFQTGEGEMDGPQDLDSLKKAFASGKVELSTCVWCEEIDAWLEVMEVKGLTDLLA
jgi:hypothetical protein